MRVSNNPYVIDGGYKPFSMQEMLTPFLLYKDAWDKSQEQMDKYNQGADAFSYLDETLPDGSKARSIYDNYSKDLRNAEQSFSQNGLTADNSRALLGLRRRYTGEIGRLEKASTKLEKLRNLRMAQDAQDPTMIYSVDNPTIDDVLDDKNFNQYSISGNSLYKMGMTSGAAISQRHISNLELQKLKNPAFLDAVQRVGFTPEVLQAFNVNPNAIPEFKEAINSIMKSTKADTNLSGIKKEQAVQNVIRGLIDGAVYKQNDSLQQNPDYINAKEQKQFDLQERQLQLQAAGNGMVEDGNGNWTYIPEKDPSLQKAIAVQQLKNEGKTGKTGSTGSNSSSGGATGQGYLKSGYQVSYSGNDYKDKVNPEYKYDPTSSEDIGKPYSYNELVLLLKHLKVSQHTLMRVPLQVKQHPDWYTYYYKAGDTPKTAKGSKLTIIPTGIYKDKDNSGNTTADAFNAANE